MFLNLFKCNHSNESYWQAVISCGAVHYDVQAGSTLLVCGWNSKVRSNESFWAAPPCCALCYAVQGDPLGKILQVLPKSGSSLKISSTHMISSENCNSLLVFIFTSDPLIKTVYEASQIWYSCLPILLQYCIAIFLNYCITSTGFLIFKLTMNHLITCCCKAAWSFACSCATSWSALWDCAECSSAGNSMVGTAVLTGADGPTALTGSDGFLSLPLISTFFVGREGGFNITGL